MQKLNMVDADTLLYQPLDKPRFVVDGLIPHRIGIVLRLTENRQKLAHAETLLMRVGGGCLSGRWRHGQAMCCTSVWRIPFSAYRTGFFV